MPERDPYRSAGGVEDAIWDAAKRAAAADPSLDVNKRIQLEHFNRFLSRVFSGGEDSEWVLKAVDDGTELRAVVAAEAPAHSVVGREVEG